MSLGAAGVQTTLDEPAVSESNIRREVQTVVHLALVPDERRLLNDVVDVLFATFDHRAPELKGQGNAHFAPVSLLLTLFAICSPPRRGLDAAGKTTICKKLLNENIEEVSPTLGFIIRTIEYDGLVAP